ncbi:MAG: hypothetical protein ACOY4K_00640 [Pseudomonadota bacterium]
MSGSDKDFQGVVEAMAHLVDAFQTAGLAPPLAVVVRERRDLDRLRLMAPGPFVETHADATAILGVELRHRSALTGPAGSTR